MNRGFSLIELIITISITVLISLALFLNYSKFGSDIALKKTAQEIALAVREAQVYGLAVKEFSYSGSAFPGYGVHFDKTKPDSFILFADNSPANNLYDGEAEKVGESKIQTSNKITDLCLDQKISPPPPTAQCGLNILDVVYLRPYLLVSIKGHNGISEVSASSDAEVIIRSPKGTERKVVIWLTGQISVE